MKITVEIDPHDLGVITEQVMKAAGPEAISKIWMSIGNQIAAQMQNQMMSQVPDYRAHLFCCTNQRPAGHEKGCCASKGSEKLRNYMKKRAKELGLQGVRVNGAGCLDRCELGPVVVIYPEGIWYSPKNEADCDEILAGHLRDGKIIERLKI